MASTNHGTRLVSDDRDNTTHRVSLSRPAGTKQYITIKNPELGDVSVLLWPFGKE